MDANFINDFMLMYGEFQKAHSHIGSMITAEVMYLAGDATSQLVLEKKLNPRKLAFTATLAPIYGLCLEGLMETGEMVGRTISDNPLVKAALGPNLFGNLYNTFFFCNNTIGEKTNYSIKELIKNYASIFSPNEIKEKGFFNNFKEKYIDNIPFSKYKKSVIATVTGWNVVQGFNYYAIPEHLRTSFSLTIGTLWASVITAWSSKGAKQNIQKEKEL